MIYKDFGGLKLSALGMGGMRFPTNEDESINYEKTAEIIDIAMKGGVNYYDTAWGYHKGQSEVVLGKILENYDRKSYYIATKFPGYDRSNLQDKNQTERIFEKQLEKTGKEYFDFYLCHNVCEANIDQYLDRSLGVFDYLLRQKENGRIKHLGFSCHGQQDCLEKFVSEFGENLEFCQIQLNYLDAKLQHAKEKVDFLNSKNIPVWVMEPVRGGRLAKLDEDKEARLKALRPDESIPAWAFRYLQSLDGIGVTLSGMSDIEQL